ncbi:hypothetical protein GCM10010298_72750 [Streptomyces microflavus]|uniref:Uncharacterized protein n=1 Tax=Streptomyces microflavus TaxID=1919 RepID=A0A7J0CJB6_STRMI|nr:hypothetical protein Smic_09340 [Streptomyces microflavus]GGX96857.1 hypothetical protein GCM10010298_72750 [Streptomyces microflavus]
MQTPGRRRTDEQQLTEHDWVDGLRVTYGRRGEALRLDYGAGVGLAHISRAEGAEGVSRGGGQDRFSRTFRRLPVSFRALRPASCR